MKSALNLTKGKPALLILSFTIPYLIGDLFQQVYNIADTVIVGQMLGISSLAAVGSAGSIMNFCLTMASGLTMGFCVFMAQRLGADDNEGLRKAFAMSILLVAAITVIFTVVFSAFVPQLLRLIKTPEDILNDADAYLTVIFLGLFATMLFDLLSNAIRALGDSKTPLIFLAAACIINVILDFIFIKFLKLNVFGAALATVIAQLVSGILCVVHVVKNVSKLHIKISDFIPDTGIIARLLKIGLPMMFLNGLVMLGTVLVQMAMNALGTEYTAAFTAAGKIDSIAMLPIFSFAAATAVYVAQNYGAMDLERIKSGINSALIMCAAWNIFIGVIMILFGRELIRLVIGSKATETVIQYGYIYLFIEACFEIVLTPLDIFKRSSQSMGCVVVPTATGILELICRAVFVSFLPQALGYVGVCLVSPLTWVITLIPISIQYFYKMHRIKCDLDWKIT